jgi:hypothetical protein
LGWWFRVRGDHTRAKRAELPADRYGLSDQRVATHAGQHAVVLRELELCLQLAARLDRDVEEAGELTLTGRAAPLDDRQYDRLPRLA